MILHRLVLVLALAACGGKSPPPTVQNEVASQPAPAPAPPPKSKNEVMNEKLRSFADDMCTCKDKVCADKVQAGMSAWAEEVGMVPGNEPEPTPTEADMRALTEISTRYAECMTTAMTAP